jgi:hypothetical protein
MIPMPTALNGSGASRDEWSRIIINAAMRDLLLADVETHFQAFTQTPDDVLRHIGSPFVPDKEKDATQLQTHAA